MAVFFWRCNGRSHRVNVDDKELLQWCDPRAERRAFGLRVDAAAAVQGPGKGHHTVRKQNGEFDKPISENRVSLHRESM